MTVPVDRPKRQVCNTAVTAEHHRGTRFPVALRYDTSDPYAVTFVFPGQVWVFGRDVLQSGLVEASGELDVQVEPDPDSVSVLLHLNPPGQAATFAFDMQEIGDWVDRIYALVPAGSESEHMDMDAFMADLTRGAWD